MEEVMLFAGFRIMRGTISSSNPCGPIFSAASSSWTWVNMVGNEPWSAVGGLPWVSCICGASWTWSWPSCKPILLGFLDGEGTF